MGHPFCAEVVVTAVECTQNPPAFEQRQRGGTVKPSRYAGLTIQENVSGEGLAVLRLGVARAGSPIGPPLRTNAAIRAS